MAIIMSQISKYCRKCLVLSGQLFKTQKYLIYKDIKQRKVANPHILRSLSCRKFGNFA